MKKILQLTSQFYRLSFSVFPLCLVSLNNHKSFSLMSSFISFLFNLFFFQSNEILGMSTGIDDLVGIRWDLAACLFICWTIVFGCLYNGLKSMGKVSSSFVLSIFWSIFSNLINSIHSYPLFIPIINYVCSLRISLRFSPISSWQFFWFVVYFLTALWTASVSI